MEIGSSIAASSAYSASLFASEKLNISKPVGPSAGDAEIAAAGEEFESVFLSMLLKNMRSTVSGEGMFAGDNSDTFGGMFDMFMSQHLAASNALGMGTMIEGFLGNSNTPTEG